MIFINEKLPHPEASLRNEIAFIGYITSTNNSVLTVRFDKDDGYPSYVPKLKKQR